MYNTERDRPEILLTCFFKECETQFRFLELKHGFHYFSGLVDYKGGRQVITPYKNQKIENGFQAMTRYEKDDDAFEITFDGLSSSIEGYAYYNRINRFEFSEVLEAAKRVENAALEKRPAFHHDGMQEAMNKIATPFKDHIKYFMAPGPKMIDRILTMRGKRIEHKIRAHYQTMIEDVSIRAAKAFAAKDYRAVIEFLTPYERDLSGADLKKLQKARENCKAPG